METERTIANISQKAGVPKQNMHHFISNSPWSGPRLIKQARLDITMHPHFESGSILIGDESADDRNGKVVAGGGRQYNGRLGEVDECQVAVFLSIANGTKHNWIDGELFLPEKWFDEKNAELREQIGLPPERIFQTKIDLFWQLLQRTQNEGVQFDAVAVDSFYGKSFWLREKMDKADIEFYADIPAGTKVYLSRPEIGLPKNKRGPKAKKERVLSPFSYKVKDLPTHSDVLWQTLTLRPTERGMLTAEFARLRVWTVEDDMSITEQWLLMRKEGKKHTYTLDIIGNSIKRNEGLHYPLSMWGRTRCPCSDKPLLILIPDNVYSVMRLLTPPSN